MVEMFWPAVAVLLIVVGNMRLSQWLKLKEPLADKQYNELSAKIKDLQREVSSLSINQGLRHDTFR